MKLHKIAEFHSERFNIRTNITSNFATSPCLKSSSNKTKIQMKLVGMIMILYCTKLHLCECRGS
jgi:hypothetical protein